MAQDAVGRRSLLTAGMGAAVALGLGGDLAGAQVPAMFQPPRHEHDDWLDQVPGKHRVIIDATSATGAGEALLFARNLFNGNRTPYGLADTDVATVVCYRHDATRFGFGDAIWARYGQIFSDYLKFTDPKTQKAPTTNVYTVAGYGEDLSSLGVTIPDVQKRGVRFAICDGSTRRVSQLLARATKGIAEDIYQELVGNAIPGGRFVNLGVIAVTRAQERGYALLSVG
jgi:intracellular sulfur oxidation DsrE/DsrF family protein